MRYYDIIIEGYKEAEREFSQTGTPDQVKDMIQKYRDLVNRNQVQGNERNIDYWRKQGWESFSKFVIDKSNQPSKKQVKKGNIEGDVIILRDDAKWRIVIPLDKNASVREGRGSDWCTAKADKPYFDEYFYKDKISLVYCIKKYPNGKIDFNSDMWAIVVRRSGVYNIFDKQDNECMTFNQETGLNDLSLIKSVLLLQNKIDEARQNWTETDTVSQLPELNEALHYNLIEGYKEAEREFSQTGTPEQVKDLIQKYRDLVNRNQVQGNERNIDWWRKQGWDAFAKFVTDKSAQPSKKQVKLGKAQGDVIVLRDDAKWRIVIPLDKKASMREGRGSHWCTASTGENHFNTYFHRDDQTLIYCIKKETDGRINFNSSMWAICINMEKAERYELFDKMDIRIKVSEFIDQTGLTPDKIISVAAKYKKEIDTHRNYFFNSFIQSIKSGNIPSEKLQLNAIERHSRLIKDIIRIGIKPSEQVQLTAVKQNGDLIRDIIKAGIKLSEQVQLAAVENEGYLIKDLIEAGIKPSEQVQLAAIENDFEYAIKSILDVKIKPSEQVQLIAVTKDAYLIKDLIEAGIKPSKQVQLAAIKQNFEIFEYMLYRMKLKPSNTVQLFAVQKNGSSIYDIIESGIKPSEAVQLAAIQQDPFNIEYIIDSGIKPSESVQLAAVKQEGRIIKYIKKPSEAVKKAAGIK